MGFRPLHDRVVIRRMESEAKTAGGIIIPDTAKEKPMEGKVVSVGPGARDDNGRITPLDVKAGDTVLFVTEHSRRRDRGREPETCPAPSNVFCKREILKVAKIFPQQGGGEFCHPSLRIRESLTRLLGPSNSSR